MEFIVSTWARFSIKIFLFLLKILEGHMRPYACIGFAVDDDVMVAGSSLEVKVSSPNRLNNNFFLKISRGHLPQVPCSSTIVFSSRKI